MSNEYPPVAFYFKLSFSGSSGKSDASFQEVSGISMETTTEPITEGGNNAYTHKVPTGTKYSNLVLKRGLVPQGSDLAKWCLTPLTGLVVENIQTKTVVVQLLNEKGTPLKSWNFVNAWPVKWSLSNLDSVKNEVAFETLELAYSYFTII